MPRAGRPSRARRPPSPGWRRGRRRSRGLRDRILRARAAPRRPRPPGHGRPVGPVDRAHGGRTRHRLPQGRRQTRPGYRNRWWCTARSRSRAATQMALAAMASTPRPSALFATNNFIAIGVLHALDELGIRVPDDIAVVGLDDLPEAMVTFPFLTVAAQPAFELGRAGCQHAPRPAGGPGPPDTRGHPPHHAGDPAVERGPAGLTAPPGPDDAVGRADGRGAMRTAGAPRRTAGERAAWVRSACDPREQSFILIRSERRTRPQAGRQPPVRERPGSCR